MFTKRNCSIALNSAIVLFELIGFAIAFIKNGPKTLVYYTQDSNLILLVACAIYLYYLFRSKTMPGWVGSLKFVATCMVTLTFLVVVFILTPMAHSFKLFYTGSNLYHHVLGPILAVVTFLMFESELMPSKKDLLWAIIPTLIYAVVTSILNLARVLNGPYPFLRVHDQPWYMSLMWFILIPGSAFGFSVALRAIKLHMK